MVRPNEVKPSCGQTSNKNAKCLITLFPYCGCLTILAVPIFPSKKEELFQGSWGGSITPK